MELRTLCGSCGQPIPVNGPYRRLSCPACLEETQIPDDILGGLLNDFDEEYQGLSDGQGHGGTLMSGSGTCKYGLWRLFPRCSRCGKPLPLTGSAGSGVIRCEGCAAEHHLFPAPDWLMTEVPSIECCITPQPPADHGGSGVLLVPEGSVKPIVMSCPQCGGALSVSTGSRRIMECVYCGSEIHVPDQVWKRLHPVMKTLEWFVGLQGKNRAQLRSELRVRD